jgi:hypothetical protein
VTPVTLVAWQGSAAGARQQRRATGDGQRHVNAVDSILQIG